MHELGIIKEIFEVMEREMEKAGGRRVTAVSLKVGSLSDVTPDHLRESFEACSQGTFAEGLEIAIEEVQAEAECLECGRVFHPDALLMQCSGCDSFRCRLVRGREIVLNTVEIAKE